MNTRIFCAVVATLALTMVAVAGATYSAQTAIEQVGPNTVRAGTLLLDLDAAGHAGTSLDFTGLLPGQRRTTLMWVADNDASSAVPGQVELSFGQVVDRPGPCDVSVDKVTAEQQSGIAGCSLSHGRPTGTPRRGTLSWLLAFDVRSAAGQCAGKTPMVSLIPHPGPGDLHRLHRSSAGGTTLRDASDGPLLVQPGQGVCVAVTTWWPPDATAAAKASPRHPIDNAAQGDSLHVDVRFSLIQVGT